MNKPRTRRIAAFGLAALTIAGCKDSITSAVPPASPKHDGAYLGAGFNVQPPPTTAQADTTQRGGAYLGAGF
jgi:hypothetical protein